MNPRNPAAFSPCRPKPYPAFSLPVLYPRLSALDFQLPKSAAGADFGVLKALLPVLVLEKAGEALTNTGRTPLEVEDGAEW